jgi:hypothetical protein
MIHISVRRARNIIEALIAKTRLHALASGHN